MTDSLAVAVNRDGLHTLDVPTRFEAGGPFVVELHNHGEAAHVHLNLDDRLSEVARVRATNHYVEAGESRQIDIEVRDPSAWSGGAVRGRLKVVVGHGRETHHVNVTLDPAAAGREMPVDPDLATPNADDGSESRSPLRVLPVIVLGSVAVLFAAAAVLADGGVDAVVGGLALAAAGLCAVAAYYLFR